MYDKARYFLKSEWETSWTEVSEEQFVRAERAAGFRNIWGPDDKPATGGFSSGSVAGRVRYNGEDCT